MRLFIAVDLDAAVRDRLGIVVETLRTAAPRVRWTPPDHIHFTVKFLGEQPEALVAPLADALRSVASEHRAMPVVLGGLGAFPNLRRPRIVWMGVRDPNRLELLQHDVELACERLGVPVDGRPFRPHLTLGRAGENVPDEQLQALARAARAQRFEEESMVDSVRLMQSELGRGGPVYTVLAAAALRAA